MRFLLRPANIFVLATYLLLSFLPFVPFLFGKTQAEPGRLLATTFVAWVLVWGVFQRPAWFHWLLLPAFVALPVELYLQIYYGQGISTHHLGIIAETSPKEALEFLGSKVWLLGGVALGVLAWWWASWRAAWKTRDLDWRDASRWIALGVLSAVLLIWLYGKEVGFQPASFSVSVSASASESEDSSLELLPDALRAQLPTLPRWARVPFELDAFGKTWPFGLIARAQDFW